MNAAVITADIVNSTRLKKSDLKKLTVTLSGIFRNCPFEFYRGDSFQAYVADSPDALRLVLLSRAAAKRTVLSEKYPVGDITASIGIADVKKHIKSVSTETGEPFITSGRAFDEIKDSGTRLVIRSTDDWFNTPLKIAAAYADHLFSKLTTKQSAVIFELLSGSSQTEIAKKFKKSQATINRHAKAGEWPALETLLADYRLLTEKL